MTSLDRACAIVLCAASIAGCDALGPRVSDIPLDAGDETRPDAAADGGAPDGGAREDGGAPGD